MSDPTLIPIFYRRRSRNGPTVKMSEIISVYWRSFAVGHFFPTWIAAWAFVFSINLKAIEPIATGEKWTAIQRTSAAHLKAAHADIEAIKAARKNLGPLGEFKDVKAILHAHAEDSAHTGGTRAEMLADAKTAGVKVIMLSDHFRPPRDFINDSWRGMHEGVLFMPGSEDRGFLLHPSSSIVPLMKGSEKDLIEACNKENGLIFLSHIEERETHSMDQLTGLEIYNRHYDAKNDRAGLINLALRITDPKDCAALTNSVATYPDEFLAAQVEYPTVYLNKWDTETLTRRLAGIAANDCHHNQVLIVKMVDDKTLAVGTIVDADEKMQKVSSAMRPGIPEMTQGRKAGDVLVRLDVDPYRCSFNDSSTHLFLKEITEESVRAGLHTGHCYVSHDWMCDPAGFAFVATSRSVSGDAGGNFEKLAAIMGDEIALDKALHLSVRYPVTCHTRLVQNGKVIKELDGSALEFDISEKGVYRVEGWLKVDGEWRGWIYSNPIYVR